MKKDLSKLKDLTVTDSAGKNKVTIDFVPVKGAALTLRALYHPLRRQILELIQNEGNMMVTEMYKKLKEEQSVTSQHLGILRRAQIVIARRDGKRVYYAINAKRIAEILDLAKELDQNKG